MAKLQANLKRDTQARILDIITVPRPYPIVDGQLLFATDTGAIYEDVYDGGILKRIPCGGSVNIIDNLTSTSAVDVLSANQGRVLNTTKLDVTNIIAGVNITTDVSGNNVTINSLGGGGSAYTKVITTAPMWSGIASPYILTITDNLIRPTSWVEVYGFTNGDKIWITDNLIDSTPIIIDKTFQINFKASNVGLVIVYTISEVK